LLLLLLLLMQLSKLPQLKLPRFSLPVQEVPPDGLINTLGTQRCCSRCCCVACGFQVLERVGVAASLLHRHDPALAALQRLAQRQPRFFQGGSTAPHVEAG
jgi:hypothetical protein